MGKKTRIPLADDTRPRVLPSSSGCRCTNHLGRKKTEHASKDAALQAIIRQHLPHGGQYRAYPCPTSNKWHVTSREEERNDERDTDH